MALVLQEVDPIFQPAMRIIEDIKRYPSDLTKTQITTTIVNQYFTGDIVRIVIPKEYSMQQLNGVLMPIEVITEGLLEAEVGRVFIIDIDIRGFDSFSIPVTPKQYPQVIPIGEVTSTLKGARRNILRDGHR